MQSLNDTVETLTASPKMEVGKNITANQPDVEVLAMLLRDFPVSKAAFNTARGEREWIMLQAAVVGVGPAGFSSVPYVATQAKKKDGKQNLKRLYEDGAESNKVTVFPYEKGKTNKDKGDRVDVMTDEDESETAASAVLQSGLCLTQFMREEAFGEENKFFVGRQDVEVLPAGTMVFLQVSASNVEQARKGNLFKVRKMKVSDDSGVAIDKQLRDNNFPRSRAEFDVVMQHMSEQRAVQKQRYTGPSRFFYTVPDVTAFACEDTESDSVVLAEFSAETDEVFCAKDIVLAATGCHDVQRAIKIMTLALATKSLSVVVCSNQLNDGLLLNKRHEHEVSWMCIDFVKMLDLKAVATYLDVKASPSDFVITSSAEQAAEVVVWCNKRVIIPTESGKKRYAVFRLEGQEQYNTSELLNTTNIKTLVADGAGGAHLPLHVYLLDEKAAVEESLQTITSNPDVPFTDSSMRLLSVQVHKSMAGKGVGKKRKRTLFSDERDTCLN